MDAAAVVTSVERERWLRYWERTASTLDASMRFMDRVLFRDSRQWVCGQAMGDVLEVGVGSGLYLTHYRPGIRLVAIDLSPAMVALTRTRATEVGREVDVRVGDAEALDFPEASFDSVVCTFSLCAIPDDRKALEEMVRVLRPGGVLLLADHVAATSPPIRGLQRLVEVASVRLAGEHFSRRPLDTAAAMGLQVQRRERFALDVVERLATGKPVIALEGDDGL